jgi:sn-glycerol 3-phosphate transport system ATP-binding protein
MNIVPGVVAGEGRVTVGGHALIVDDMRAGLPRGAKVDIGLRPEDLVVEPGATDGHPLIEVDFVEELGATQLFHGTLGGAAIVVQCPTDKVPTTVKRLALSVAPALIHVFDPETGARMGREPRAAAA